MQFDHVLLYMSFGGCVALSGFILAILAKSGDGHGSLEVWGLSIGLQAAGGILVIGIGAVVFLMPMIMGRDLNQSAEIQRLNDQIASLNSEGDQLRREKGVLEGEKSALASKLAAKKSLPIQDILPKWNYVTHIMSRSYSDNEEGCARKLAKHFFCRKV